MDAGCQWSQSCDERAGTLNHHPHAPERGEGLAGEFNHQWPYYSKQSTDSM